MKNQAKGQLQAFTLIELLVIISIITFLASIVITSVRSARVQATDTRRYADSQTVAKAINLYFQDNGTYPTYTIADVSFKVLDSTLPEWDSQFGPKLAQTYLKSFPDPVSATQEQAVILGIPTTIHKGDYVYINVSNRSGDYGRMFIQFIDSSGLHLLCLQPDSYYFGTWMDNESQPYLNTYFTAVDYAHNHVAQNFAEFGGNITIIPASDWASCSPFINP